MLQLLGSKQLKLTSLCRYSWLSCWMAAARLRNKPSGWMSAWMACVAQGRAGAVQVHARQGTAGGGRRCPRKYMPRDRSTCSAGTHLDVCRDGGRGRGAERKQIPNDLADLQAEQLGAGCFSWC